MEHRHWMPGTAVEMGGSGAAGLVGRASVGRGSQILRAEETALGEVPLQGKAITTFRFFLG